MVVEAYIKTQFYRELLFIFLEVKIIRMPSMTSKTMMQKMLKFEPVIKAVIGKEPFGKNAMDVLLCLEAILQAKPNLFQPILCK